MKLLLFIVVVVGLCSATLIARAAQDKDFYLARCAEQIGQRYGSGQDIKLVSVRRSGSGMRVKVAITLAPAADGVEKVQFMTCLIPNDRTRPGGDTDAVSTPAEATAGKAR